MKFRLTIRSQITIIFAIILLFSFSLNFLISNIFLKDYFFIEKESVLRQIQTTLNQSHNEQSYMQAYQLCETNNITLLIVSDNFQIITSYNLDEATAVEKNLKQLKDYIEKKSQETSLTGFYDMERLFENDTNAPYLEMYGTLNHGDHFLMKVEVTNIDKNLDTMNSFSYFSYVLCICIGIVAVNFLSNLITRPIEKLCGISQKMCELDFSEMYKDSNTEEVNILGQNLNNLSSSLDNALQGLQLSNKQLEIDLNKKTQVDDMRKEFISNISHELKTPIAVIQGYAEGLKECESDEDREFYCDIIADEAQKMDKMVKSLIELNKLEFGQDNDNMVFLNLREFVQNIAKTLKVMLDDIEFEIVGDKDCFVIFDEIKLEQIITNYLTNAIHYVDDNKKIKVTISSGEKIKLSVFNSGSHISEHDKNQIWDKFYKIDKARTRTYGGSGIGLSIVSAIMKKYGEDFGVNNVDGGVEFYIYLRKA